MDEDNIIEMDSLHKSVPNTIKNSINFDDDTTGPLSYVYEVDENSEPIEIAHPTAEVESSVEIVMDSPTFNDHFSNPTYLDKNTKKRIDLQITKRSDEYLPVFRFSEFFQDDKNLVKYKRTKIAFNVHGAIPVLIFQCAVYATRASLYKTLYLNVYFSCAFILSVFAVGIFMLLIIVILLERYTDPVWVKGTIDVLNKKQHSDVSHSVESYGNDADNENDHSAYTSNKKSVAGGSTSSKRKHNWRARKNNTESYRIMRTTPFLLKVNRYLKRTIHHWVFQEAFDAMAITGATAIGKTWSQ